MSLQRDTEVAAGAAGTKRHVCWGAAPGHFSKSNGGESEELGGNVEGEEGGMTKDRE